MTFLFGNSDEGETFDGKLEEEAVVRSFRVEFMLTGGGGGGGGGGCCGGSWSFLPLET